VDGLDFDGLMVFWTKQKNTLDKPEEKIMTNLINNYINGLMEQYSDEEKNDFKLITPAPNEKIDLLRSIYPNIPVEIIQLLKKINGSSGEYKGNYVRLDFFKDGYDDGIIYEFCSVDEMLEHTKIDASWLDIYKSELVSKSDILEDEELFSEEIKVEAPIKDRLIFAQTDYSNLYIDFNPSKLGTTGQIISYIHDPDMYQVVHDSFSEFLKINVDCDFECFNDNR